MNKVESMLLELKDTSEFMVDLAYSSLLYNNVEIAEEVIFLEGKMDDLQRRLDDMGSSVEDVQKLEKQLEETREECSRLEQAVTESRKRQRREALDRLGSGRSRMQEASDAHDVSLAELSERREALRRSDFGELTQEELEAQVSADREELASLNQQKKTFW